VSKTGPLHVLVVDDEPSVLITIRLLGRRLGWATRTTTNPLEVIGLAKELRPDVILSDYSMPGCIGPELITALRNDPETRDIPVVLMSGEARKATPGASDFVEKPFKVETLKNALHRAVEQSTPRPGAGAGSPVLPDIPKAA
jgi:CheY-like chemotaxis protein